MTMKNFVTIVGVVLVVALFAVCYALFYQSALLSVLTLSKIAMAVAIGVVVVSAIAVIVLCVKVFWYAEITLPLSSLPTRKISQVDTQIPTLAQKQQPQLPRAKQFHRRNTQTANNAQKPQYAKGANIAGFAGQG